MIVVGELVSACQGLLEEHTMNHATHDSSHALLSDERWRRQQANVLKLRTVLCAWHVLGCCMMSKSCSQRLALAVGSQQEETSASAR